MRIAFIGRLYFILLSLALLAGEISAGEIIPHPDGLLGRPSLYLSGQYSSVTALQGTAFVDRKFISIGLKIPVIKSLTLSGNYCAMVEDSVVHSYYVKFAYFISNPVLSRRRANPDGPVGSPVITAFAGGYFPDRNPENHHLLVGMEALLPLSTNFSLSAGGKYYDEDTPRQLDNYYGRIGWFLSAYAEDAIYSNPDGPEGTPVFLITGGGSKHGVFGQFDIIFPLEPKMTLAVYIKGERVPVPYFRAASAGFYIKYYPGNGE